MVQVGAAAKQSTLDVGCVHASVAAMFRPSVVTGDRRQLVPLAEQASLCHFLTMVPERESGVWSGPP